MNIKDVLAREVLDSRGNPTLEVEIVLENGIRDYASVPSGASTGSREALELRDNDPKRYHGKGVLKALNNVLEIVKPKLIGVSINQGKIDQILLDLDSTPNKTILGANVTLAVSLACLKVIAKCTKKGLYKYVATDKLTLPIPMMNIINGGMHAGNNLDIQEFMIVPVVKSFKERVRAGSEVFHSLKGILEGLDLGTAVGDEGGFAPQLENNEMALKLIMSAITDAGYTPGKDILIALDVAASSFYDKNTNMYRFENKNMSADDLSKYYIYLVNKYPIISIEDPFNEDDFDSLAVLTKILGNRIMLVGDDYFVTNTKYLQEGINKRAGNAILLKPNQVGTISEMVNTISLARKNNYKMIISHRSGETEETYIADLAVGLCIPYIKTGSLSRGERIAKYNRLIRIEEELERNE